MKSKFHVLIGLMLMGAVMGVACAEIPPTPITLTPSVNGGWVNYTWVAGSGNLTDTYNVSVSVSGAAQTWVNGSSVTNSNNDVGLDEWAEIWVYAYNTTGNSNLSVGYAYSDTQADRSEFGEVVDLIEAVPDMLNPIPDTIIVVIRIMVIIAIGLLITGVIGAIFVGLQRKIKM